MTNQPLVDTRVEIDEKVAKRAIVKRYVIAILISLCLFAIVLYGQGIFDGSDAENDEVNHNATAWAFLKLTNAFSIMGVLCCCFGGLIFCSSKGAYDTLFFGVRQALGVMFKNPKDLRYKDLYEYKQAKAQNRPNFKYLFWIGLGYLAVGVIFLVLYKIVNIP